jgi:hypothetical protein
MYWLGIIEAPKPLKLMRHLPSIALARSAMLALSSSRSFRTLASSFLAASTCTATMYDHTNTAQ